MARPIWTGTLSFGLLNVPVSLMTGERRSDLHFKMLDSRDNKPVRYERVNAETGEDVPWKDIVKAFEYDKGSYVVIEKEDLKSAAPEGHETVEVEAFVRMDAIPVQYFDKPYILVPGKKAEKGYVLLRETLKKTGQIGIARVVIRTREHLAAVMPQEDALLLMLLRYPQELVDPNDYKLPAGETKDYRISTKELAMASQLIESMSGLWQPDDYHDEFRERLQKVIDTKLKSKGVAPDVEVEDVEPGKNAATNVVDFMSLLQQSIKGNKRTPAKSAAKGSKGSKASASSKSSKSASAGKSSKKKAATKAPSTRKTTRKAG